MILGNIIFTVYTSRYGSFDRVGKWSDGDEITMKERRNSNGKVVGVKGKDAKF